MTPLHARDEWGARPARAGYATIQAEGITCHYGGPSPWSIASASALHDEVEAADHHEPADAGDEDGTPYVPGGMRVRSVLRAMAVDRSSPDAFEATTDHAVCPDICRSYQSWHMDHNGWTDLAYSSLVCPHGHRYEGRPSWARTAANGTDDGNSRSLAVCYLAGHGDPLTTSAMRAYGDEAVRLGAPLVWCHSDWVDTACPGDPIRAWRDDGFPAPDQGDDLMTPEQDRLLRDIHQFMSELKDALGGDGWQDALRDHLAGGGGADPRALRSGDTVILSRSQAVEG